MSISTLNAILADTLAGAKLPPARLNASGMTEITLHGLNIGLEFLEKDNRLVLYCSVGHLPPDPPADLCEFLLEADLFGARLGGGHIGLYAPSRTLLFSLSLDADALSAPKLANALDRFAETAAPLINELESRLCSSSPPAAPFLGNMLWV